jgi:small GTP-binding protein
MLQKKICMLGAHGVGKTSLVRRVVESMFDEKYQTTLGVKIDKRVIEVRGTVVTLLVWDLAGEDEVEQIKLSHLRGASGYILVVDGCRKSTLDRAVAIRERVEESLGRVPFVLALNKADLRGQWDLSPAIVQEILARDAPVFLTSAKTGEAVEAMFEALAMHMLTEA